MKSFPGNLFFYIIIYELPFSRKFQEERLQSPDVYHDALKYQFRINFMKSIQIKKNFKCKSHKTRICTYQVVFITECLKESEQINLPSLFSR